MIDAVLTVHHDARESSLRFTLDIQHPQLVTTEPEQCHVSPDASEVLDALFKTINKLLQVAEANENTPHSDAVRSAVRRLQGIGERVFDELVPEKIREHIQDLPHGASLQIRSNETFIPWELLRMPKGATPEGAFLAEAFCLTRWLVGHQQTETLPLRQIAVVTPQDSKLTYAFEERDFILGLAKPRTTHIEATPTQVMEAFDAGDHDGWHFCGHGYTGSTDSDTWSLVLENHATFTAHEVRTARQLHQTQPLIFANACMSGRGGAGLRRTGGLGRSFVEAGAGAFIGAHWLVGDASAFVFSQVFYTGFLDGLHMGEALRQARLSVRDQFPGDPTWLAYTAFAHPLATCRNNVEEHLPGPHREPQQTTVERRKLKPLKPIWRPRAMTPTTTRRVLLAALIALPLLLAALGLMTHRSRETMLRLSAPLTYSSMVYLETGLEAGVSLFVNALASPLNSRPEIRASAWALIFLGSLCYAVFRWHRRRLWLVDTALALAFIMLWVGMSLYTFALRARHGVEQRGDTSLLCSNYFLHPGKPATIPEQIIVESCSWLAHPTQTNEEWRQGLSGLAGFFLLASGVAIWGAIWLPRRRRWYSGFRLGLLVGHLVVLLLILRQLPLAHAYYRWGLNYPAEEATPGCCRYYVSEGAQEPVSLLWGPHCPERTEDWESKRSKFVGHGHRTVSKQCP